MNSNQSVGAVLVMPITDENRKEFSDLAMSVYIGETCPYCKVKFETLQDLEDAIWTGQTKYGHQAHKECFDKGGEDFKKRLIKLAEEYNQTKEVQN